MLGFLGLLWGVVSLIIALWMFVWVVMEEIKVLEIGSKDGAKWTCGCGKEAEYHVRTLNYDMWLCEGCWDEWNSV